MTMPNESYGQLVQRLRKARGWTQRQLAAASGVPLRTLQDVELDKHSRPQRATRLALNQALEIAGDPDQERAEWPEDVTTILDIFGAFLMLLTPEQRLEWLRDATIRSVGLQNPPDGGMTEG